jgi:anti-sigma factor RsiW
MFCDEALDAIEPIAAGELTADGRVADHLASCPNCAAALDDARQLERMLQARPVPRTTSQFTSRTMARVRRARWRSEQFLDIGFNFAVGVVVVAMVAGVWMLMHRSGLTAVSNDAVDLFSTAFVTLARRVAPSVPLYAGATALLVTALGIWWWAERDAAL